MKMDKTTYLQEAFPKGTRILLNHMGPDPRPVPDGTRGTVRIVDDIGQVHCLFDNGRELALAPWDDDFRKLTPTEIAKEQDGLQIWLLTCLHTNSANDGDEVLGAFFTKDSAIAAMRTEAEKVQPNVAEEDQELCWACDCEMVLGTYNGDPREMFGEPEIWHYTVSPVSVK